MVKYHYGIYVDSEKPTTGVVSNNNIAQFISDEMCNGINLTYEEFASCTEELENWEYSPSDTWLIGGWIKNEGQFEPDKDSEYSAIVGEICTQVVWSKSTRRCALCSPCYPGQGDLDSEGEFLAYDVPADARDYPPD
jgi:hypothetical protein